MNLNSYQIKNYTERVRVQSCLARGPLMRGPSRARDPLPPHVLEADLAADRELEERLLLQTDLQTRVRELEDAVERENATLRASRDELASVERATEEALASTRSVERDVDAARGALDRSRMTLIALRERDLELQRARESVASSNEFLSTTVEATVPQLERTLRDLKARHDGQQQQWVASNGGGEPNSWNSLTRSLAAMDAAVDGLEAGSTTTT